MDHASLRRSLYLKAIRNRPERLLKSLDGVDGLNSIPKRSVTTTPTQALQLMNGEWVRARAVAMANRILDETNSDEAFVMIDRAFQLAYGRSPSNNEASVAETMLRESESSPAEPKEEPEDAGSNDSQPIDSQTLALADLCHVLLNSNEFVYVD